VNGNEPLVRRGRIAGLHRKPRQGRALGIPKPPVDRLTVTGDGVEGDFNRWRAEKAGGDPDQAVLLLGDEILGELGAEGWPVGPGDLGENLRVAGVSPEAFHPGARVTVGDVVLELSKRCDPCIVLYSLPYDGLERGPAFLRALQGRRGWFARVVRGGVIDRSLMVEVTG
jgi:MOSC domain-containing protein YiiM